MSIQPAPERPAPRAWPWQTRNLVPYSPNSVTAASSVVALVSLIVHVRTLMPGVAFFDPGEAQTMPVEPAP